MKAINLTWSGLFVALLIGGCDRTPSSSAAPVEVVCASAAPAAASPWYATITPSEHGNDSRRTHTFASACSTLGGERKNLAMASVAGLPGLYNIVTRKPDEIFALGGSFGLITEGGGPFVAAVDTTTMKLRWRTPLPGITTADWNYPGVMGVHQNGDLYAVYGHHMVRLDPADGRVKAHVLLPVNQSAQDVAYNGFTLLMDGSIVTKSIHRKPGCTEPDFKAFFKCKTQGLAASTVVLLDPETLTIRQSLIAPEHMRFRATSTVFEGAEYVYLPGEDRIRRYRYLSGQLALDPDWNAAYRSEGQTPGTAVAVLGGWIVIQTSGIPATGPMAIVAVSQRDASKQFRIEPFAGNSVDGSFIPSLPTVDAENNRIYTFDGFAGQLAALNFDPQRGLSVAWKARQRSFAFSALVGSAKERVFVSTDMGGWLEALLFERAPLSIKLRVMRANNSPPKEALVWRDAATGQELGRSPARTAVGGGALTPGYHGWLFAPDLRGEALYRFSPAS